MSDSTELLDDEISLVRFIEYNSPNLSSIGVTLVSEEISKALSWDELELRFLLENPRSHLHSPGLFMRASSRQRW